MGMSNPEISDQVHINCDISSSPITPETQIPDQQKEQPQDDNNKTKKDETEEPEAEQSTRAPDPNETTPYLGESDVIDEENDGFRTPTSLDHRIPEIRPFPPPPPVKIICRSSSSKTSSRRMRKRCYVPRNDQVLLDLSKEVESMFPPMIQANFGRKIKRAKRNC